MLEETLLPDFTPAEEMQKLGVRPAENKVAFLGFLKEEGSCVWGGGDVSKCLLNAAEG